MYQSVNPFNGKIIRTFETQSDEAMWAALELASKTFQERRVRAGYAQRAEVLGAAARLMEERVEELAHFAALNLMAGNTLLVKHAPGAPQCALVFEKVPRACGRLPGYRDRDAAEPFRPQRVCAICAGPRELERRRDHPRKILSAYELADATDDEEC